MSRQPSLFEELAEAEREEEEYAESEVNEKSLADDTSSPALPSPSTTLASAAAIAASVDMAPSRPKPHLPLHIQPLPSTNAATTTPLERYLLKLSGVEVEDPVEESRTEEDETNEEEEAQGNGEKTNNDANSASSPMSILPSTISPLNLLLELLFPFFFHSFRPSRTLVARSMHWTYHHARQAVEAHGYDGSHQQREKENEALHSTIAQQMRILRQFHMAAIGVAAVQLIFFGIHIIAFVLHHLSLHLILSLLLDPSAPSALDTTTAATVTATLHLWPCLCLVGIGVAVMNANTAYVRREKMRWRNGNVRATLA